MPRAPPGNHVLLGSPLWGAPGGRCTRTFWAWLEPSSLLCSLAVSWVSAGLALGGHFEWVGCAGGPHGWVPVLPGAGGWVPPLPSHTGPWGQLEAGGPDTHFTHQHSVLGTRLPRAPASWRCCWRPRPPQPSSSSPKYVGPGVISLLASCPRAKAQGGGFVWAAVSLGPECGSGRRYNGRFAVFTIFSFRFT